MGFLNPKQMDEDDELPGSGLHLDLEAKVCPTCRRSALPWQERCEDCDEPVVAPGAVPAQEFALPDLAVEDPDEDRPEG